MAICPVGDFGKDSVKQYTAVEVRAKRKAAGMYQIDRKLIAKAK